MNLSLGQQRSLLDWLRLIHHHGRNRAKSSRGGLVKAVRTALFSAAVRSPPDRVRLYISILSTHWTPTKENIHCRNCCAATSRFGTVRDPAGDVRCAVTFSRIFRGRVDKADPVGEDTVIAAGTNTVTLLGVSSLQADDILILA